jgi:hypothetical protein
MAREQDADDSRRWQGTPPPGVATGASVVAHHKVVAGRYADRRDGPPLASVDADVELGQSVTVDKDEAAPLLPEVAWNTDHPFFEQPAWTVQTFVSRWSD